MRFAKMHGLGNDYVFVDTGRHRVADPARLARAVSDRHTGVGSDGLILVAPAEEGERAHLTMRIYNADGSEAEMCGNGLRCVVRLATERGLSHANPMRVRTGRGVLEVVWRAGPRFEASVAMGAPIFACEDVPARVPGVPASSEVIGWRLPEVFWKGLDAPAGWMEACGFSGTLSLASMGNPHAVLWCREPEAVPLERVGPFVERHPWFPHRVNAHVAAVTAPGEIRMRTWERGSGVTLACGTGASAVGALAVRQGLCASPMRLHLPGGELGIAWPGGEAPVTMTGPAERVFEGEWPHA